MYRPRTPLLLPIASAFALVLTAVPVIARAETVVRTVLHGAPVRIDRAANGDLSLHIASDPAVALEGNGSVRAESVSLANGADAWVARSDGARPVLVVVAAAGTAGSAPRMVLRTRLGLRGEDPGERVRTESVVADFDGDGQRDLVLFDRAENGALCGLGHVPLEPRALDPVTLTFRPVRLNPLRPELRESPGTVPVRPITAQVEPSRAPRSVPFEPYIRGVSLRAGRLSEGVPSLFASRTGEPFRVARFDATGADLALAGIPARAVIFDLPPRGVQLPSRFQLRIEPGALAFDVTLPERIDPSAMRVSVALPEGTSPRCIALVATEVDAQRPAAFHGIALQSVLDAEPASARRALIARLESDDREQAAWLLANSGDQGITAIRDALPTLSERATRLVVQALGGVRTDASARLVASRLGDPKHRDDARAALQRLGPAALAALTERSSSDPEAVAVIAQLRAPVEQRLDAIVPALTAGASVWHRARPHARALLSRALGDDRLAHWLAHLPEEPTGVSRGLALAADVARTDAQRAEIAARAARVESTAFADRFRLLRPLLGDEAGRAVVVRTALGDADPDLRTEAVAALATVPTAVPTLVRALEDRVPRVRAEAARSLTGRTEAAGVLARQLVRDRWPSVRAESALALAGNAPSAQALIRALDDSAVSVAHAATTALSRTQGAGIASALMRVAEDDLRHPSLRTDALAVLATRCDRSVAQRLFALFTRLNDPVLPPDEQAIGHAALAAYAQVDPAGARRQLGRLEMNAFGRAALDRAMRNACTAR